MTKPMTATPARPSEQRPLRADARRNYQRLLAAARTAFAQHGADASLDDIARRAGVGSGTLYRHFPTRQALLEAVYRDQVEELCSQARELLASPSPGDALATWLRAMASYATTKRGLSSLMTPHPELLSSCREALRRDGGALLDRAQRAGAVRSDTGLDDLFKLMHAISMATEQAPDGAEQADRLLGVVIDGLRPHD